MVTAFLTVTAGTRLQRSVTAVQLEKTQSDTGSGASPVVKGSMRYQRGHVNGSGSCGLVKKNPESKHFLNLRDKKECFDSQQSNENYQPART